ncbi:MAG: hypothetical protein E6Q55_30580 [Mycolicibacterium mageritense]|nr:MAG: hypothetical protein E6Q55_30580 [Mycolicibacterium mageritense]
MGAAEGVVAGGGGSPIDAAVVVVQVQQSVLRTGFGALVAGQTAEREAGENDGVAMMEQTESQNALRLGEIGPEGAAATAPSIITI